MLLKLRWALVTILSIACIDALAQTQSWPTRSVRWIVPFAAGGTSDGISRLLADRLSEKWGQAVVVDNRPGGFTVVSAVEAKNAPPDGYTLYLTFNGTMTMNPFAMSSLPYDPQRDFTPIAVFVDIPVMFITNNTIPVKTMRDFVDYVKKNPDKVSIGYAGPANQIVIGQIANELGLKFVVVPYKSGVDVTRALLSGEINAAVDAATTYPQHFKDGKLRGLAITGKKRLASVPDVPTLTEVGVTKFAEIPQWTGLSAPAGLPTPIRNKIVADLKEVTARQDVQQRMTELGLVPTWVGPEDMAKLIPVEMKLMGPIVKEMGINLN